MRRIKDILEQHAEKGRFKPTTPRYVSSTSVVSPRPASDSANVKLKEDGGLAQNTLLVKKKKPMSTATAEISFQSVKEVAEVGDDPSNQGTPEGLVKRGNRTVLKKFKELTELVAPEAKDDIKSLDSMSFLKKHGLSKTKVKERLSNEEVEQIEEGRPSQRHPLEGHEYHKKTDAELVYIAKDAHKAAEAMKSHNTTAENKYRDQANDSATVRYFRQKNGMPDWYKKKYGHIKEDIERIEEVRKMASGGRDNAGGQHYDIDNGDGTIGFGYKPGKSQPSSSHSNYEYKPEPKHPLHGKIVTAKHSDGKEVTGRLMGTEHQGTVAKIKHSSGMIHSTDAKTIKKANSGMKEDIERVEEMDKSQTPPGRDGGYQFAPGPKVSKKDIKAIKKDPAKHLSDLFAKEYAKKKMKEEVEQIEEKSDEAYNHYKKQVLPIYKKHGLSPEFAKAVNNHVAKHGSYQVWNHHGDADGQNPHWFDSEKQKVKPIKQKRGYEVSEEVEQIDEDVTKDVQKTKDGGYWSKGTKTATHYSGKKTYEYKKFDKEGKETGERHYRDAQGNYMGEETEPPFKADKPKQRVVPGKAGKGYSTARHLARMAMQKQVDKLKKPVKESLEESRKAKIVKDIVKKKKSTTEDTFQKDPELSSSLTKTQ